MGRGTHWAFACVKGLVVPLYKLSPYSMKRTSQPYCQWESWVQGSSVFGQWGPGLFCPWTRRPKAHLTMDNWFMGTSEPSTPGSTYLPLHYLVCFYFIIQECRCKKYTVNRFYICRIIFFVIFILEHTDIFWKTGRLLNLTQKKV